MTGQSRLISIALVVLYLLGCSTTRPFSPEHTKGYVLARDTIIGDCNIFIKGSLESLLGAPSLLTCLRHDYIGHPQNASILKKGSTVRVKRFLQGIDVDVGQTIVELEITDPESGLVQAVYSPDWVRHREQVVIEAPPSSGSATRGPPSGVLAVPAN